jgi:hypothetical protein
MGRIATYGTVDPPARASLSRLRVGGRLLGITMAAVALAGTLWPQGGPLRPYAILLKSSAVTTELPSVDEQLSEGTKARRAPDNNLQKPAETDLWKAEWSEHYGHWYWWNTQTYKTTWSQPASATNAEQISSLQTALAALLAKVSMVEAIGRPKLQPALSMAAKEPTAEAEGALSSSSASLAAEDEASAMEPAHVMSPGMAPKIASPSSAKFFDSLFGSADTTAALAAASTATPETAATAATAAPETATTAAAAKGLDEAETELAAAGFPDLEPAPAEARAYDSGHWDGNETGKKFGPKLDANTVDCRDRGLLRTDPAKEPDNGCPFLGTQQICDRYQGHIMHRNKISCCPRSCGRYCGAKDCRNGGRQPTLGSGRPAGEECCYRPLHGDLRLVEHAVPICSPTGDPDTMCRLSASETEPEVDICPGCPDACESDFLPPFRDIGPGGVQRPERSP